MKKPDQFDPATLSLPVVTRRAVLPRRSPPRHGPKEWFLKGPVPWPWIEGAYRRSGSALMLGLILWREAGRRRTSVVPLNLSRLGMPRSTAQWALRALEQAGLVEVGHRHGRPPVVTLRSAPG